MFGTFRRFRADRWLPVRGSGVGAALLLGPLVCAVASGSVACNQKEEVKVDKSQTSAKTEAVPTDFVLNPFLPEEKDQKVALQVRADGGAPPIAASAGSPTATGGSASAKTGASPAPAATAVGAEAEADEIKVKEPGAEPRSERRYAFALNKTETRVAVVKMSVAQGQNAQEQPPVKLTLALTAKEKLPNGARIEVKVTKFELVATNDADKALAAQASAAMAGLAGLAAIVEVSNRGKQGELNFALPETKEAKKAARAAQELLPVLQQLIEPLFPLLPAAPIGVGAQWESVSKQSDAGGATMSVVSSFTLKSWAGDAGVITSSLIRSAPKQAMQDPRMPPGSTMQVDGKGTYEWSLRFDRFPTKTVGTSDTKIIIAAGPKNVVQSNKLQVNIDEK
jgi:hypothetical protein